MSGQITTTATRNRPSNTAAPMNPPAINSRRRRVARLSSSSFSSSIGRVDLELYLRGLFLLEYFLQELAPLGELLFGRTGQLNGFLLEGDHLGGQINID